MIDGLAPHLTRNCLVAGKSTVPVGTAPALAARLAALAPEGVKARLAWNPEFLREGFAIEDTLRPERLVAGITSAGDDALLREVYSKLLGQGTPYIVTDIATAELAKVAANAFLATKISFINAMSNVCEAAGADVTTLADVLGHDSRIGRRFLSAGLGFGGGCLGKDIRAFMARAAELGVADTVEFLQQVDSINNARRRRAIDLARDLVGGSFTDVNVAILGAAFKPETDDFLTHLRSTSRRLSGRRVRRFACTTLRPSTTPGSHFRTLSTPTASAKPAKGLTSFFISPSGMSIAN